MRHFFCNLQEGYEQAYTIGLQSLQLAHQIGFKAGIAHQLEMLANIKSIQNNPEHAACLYGAAEAIREAINFPISPREKADYDVLVDAIKAQMIHEDFHAAWYVGRNALVNNILATLIDGDMPIN